MNAPRLLLKLSTSFAFAWIVMTSDLYAGIMQYEITVDVSAAPTVPGDFPSNPWSFPAGVPATFEGTFDADDTVPGPISNLSLTIGGLDIASTHPAVLESFFDPSSLGLFYVAVDASELESAVVFGDLFEIGLPPNYAVAVQNTPDVPPPLDPFIGATQNWVGTFSIADGTVVPEPSSLAIWCFMGIVGVAAGRRRRT